MRITWSSPNLLPKKLLFIDGITRSGKSLVGPIMSSFKKSYPFQHQALLDNLMPLIKKKSINLLAAKSLLINYYNQNIYCLNISRQMNFRPDDNSSLTKNKDYKFYKKNLNKKLLFLWRVRRRWMNLPHSHRYNTTVVLLCTCVL